MNKGDKIFFAIWAMLMVITIAAVCSITIPREITKKIWLPDNYHFANEKNPVEEIHVSGTAVVISFEEYKKQFSDNRHEIIVIKNSPYHTAELHYLTKEDNITYSSSVSYSGATFNFEVEPTITDSEIKLSFSPGAGGIVIAIILVGIAAFVYFVIGFLIYEPIEKRIERIKNLWIYRKKIS
ncbi:MAG: hypothetical protein NTU58_04015 [Candidatus Nealsonbacteria bacterium]|nr:hypothetical protein [Candidatus Nealsonbacteria bacterium]